MHENLERLHQSAKNGARSQFGFRVSTEDVCTILEIINAQDMALTVIFDWLKHGIGDVRPDVLARVGDHVARVEALSGRLRLKSERGAQ